MGSLGRDRRLRRRGRASCSNSSASGALTTSATPSAVQLRTVGGHLRSFGTLDEPFAYAAFLLLALATVLFWMPPGRWAVLAGLVIGVGLMVSFVRGALIVSVALVALWLVRRRQAVVGLAVLTVAVLSALALLLVDPGAIGNSKLPDGSGYLPDAQRTNGRLGNCHR